MTFGKKCKEFFGKAAEAVKDAVQDALSPQPQLQPIPVRAGRPRPPQQKQ